jgi:hypothetical protein
LETFLEKNNVTGLKTLSDELEQELGYYVKLFVIMYADDTALLAESARNLQNMLNLFAVVRFECENSAIDVIIKFL